MQHNVSPLIDYNSNIGSLIAAIIANSKKLNDEILIFRFVIQNHIFLY